MRTNTKIAGFIIAGFILFMGVPLIFYRRIFNGDFSYNHESWGSFGSFLSGIASPFVFISIVITILLARYTILKTNSLNACIPILKELREDKFIHHEKYIMNHLPQIVNHINSINDIKDKKLKASINAYCNTINNIGVLVVHRLIEEEIIIAYYGIQILTMYNLIFPLIEGNKDTKYTFIMGCHYFPDTDNGKIDRQLIANATKLQYDHFKILAEKVRKNGDKIIKKMNSEHK